MRGVLAAENARVRHLALAIACEPHQADDLAQDARLVLLRKAPPEPGKLSACLGGTMRNLLRLKGCTKWPRRIGLLSQCA